MLPFYRLLQGKNIKDIVYLLFVSSGMGLTSIFYIYGIRSTNLGASQVIYMALPAVTLVLSHFIIHEKIQITKIYGILISFIGASIVFFLPRFYNSAGLNVGNIQGNIYILLAVFSYAIYLTCIKKVKFTPMEFMYGGII
jgi:drug/metabolite transporter (DMT)-like permease